MKQLILCLALLYPILTSCQPITIKGSVINEEGTPLAGATISIKQSGKSTLADSKGNFTITNTRLNDTLIVTAIGYQTATVPNNERGLISITLRRKITQLDETIIIAYGTTTKRFNTGSITKITTAEISNQPVSNPLATLHGRVPGLLVTQSSGVTGSAVSIQLRGQSSLDPLLSRNDPLFIIDGVPFESGNIPSNQLSSAAVNPYQVAGTSPGGLSPLSSINPADIESIEVLKDADATAIYGSRGANGVILITTRKGKAGKAKLTLNISNGFSRPSSSMPMLNTAQYLLMRREAFANDGLLPNTSNAPDLLLWDTSRYTNLQKLLTGNTARTTNWQASLSAGSPGTQFLLGMAYFNQTNVFPGSQPYQRYSSHINLRHKPASARWDLQFSAIFSADDNKLLRTDLSKYFGLPPNIKLTGPGGELVWQEAGISYSSLGFFNPLAELLQPYEARNNNLSASLVLGIRISKNWNLRVSTGYNNLTTNEKSTQPKASLAPENTTLASSQLATALRSNWMAEPQLEYNGAFAKGKLQMLLGAAFQQRQEQLTSIQATGYSNDLLLNALSAAAAVTASNNSEQYNYQAVFARLNYNFGSKYILNLSGRRDGSSRFGPARRFANFAAAGAAWILSEETFFKNSLPFISFAKLRASYGVTGNDQLGNYRYLDLWLSTTNPYTAVPGLRPSSLFNPYLEWEKNNKFETALELSFCGNRIMFSPAFYIHRSSNQLISYRLPNQTGFASVTKNLPALVQNKGWEFQLTATALETKNWSWKLSANATLPSNKLLSFPGLETSSYNAIYTIGQSLSVIRKMKYTGIDPATGLYTYEDYNKDGSISTPGDLQVLGNLDPVCYGGISSGLQYSGWSVDIFFDYNIQKGTNYLAYQYLNPAGFMYNQPLLVMNRWQQPGKQSAVQRFGATAASPVFTASSRLLASDAIYSDASFIRFKNLALGYDLPASVLAKGKISSCRFYIQAQNIYTFTRYKGTDPETKSFYQLPTLRTVLAGIQLTF